MQGEVRMGVCVRLNLKPPHIAARYFHSSFRVQNLQYNLEDYFAMLSLSIRSNLKFSPISSKFSRRILRQDASKFKSLPIFAAFA